MLNYLKKYGEFEFFAENRLIFKRRLKKSTDADAAEQLPGASEGLIKDMQAQLAELRGEVKPPKAAPKKRTFHTERKDTRTVTPVTPHYKESVTIAKEALVMEEHLDRNEALLMQMVHNNLYAQYMNPAFMLYLSQSNLSEKVYPELDRVMKNPEYFSYVNKGNDRVEIVKRPPHDADKGDVDKNKAFADIPNDFLVVMETKDGHITQVGTLGLKKGSDIPWISNEKYNKDMPIYLGRWTNEHTRYLYGDEYKKWVAAGRPPEKWPGIFKNSFEPISETIKAIHVANNIEFPKRFVAMVRKRHLEFELEDPGFLDVEVHQKKQGETYDEITKEGYGEGGKLQVMVVADPDKKLQEKFGAVYQIWTRENRPNPLRVTAQGYILRQREDGSWDVDPRYHQAVRRRYYADTPEARVGLKGGATGKEARELEELDRKVGEAVEAQEKAKKLKKKREQVDKAVREAEIDKLKEVAKAIGSESQDPEHIRKRNEAIDKMNEDQLRNGIKDILDGKAGGTPEDNLNKAGAILGVEFEEVTPEPVVAAAEKPEAGVEKTEAEVIALLDKIEDAGQVAQIVEDFRAETETPAVGIDKQKEQIKKWLTEGIITPKMLAVKIAEVTS